MKFQTAARKTAALSMIFCLSAVSLIGCGGRKQDENEAAPADTESADNEAAETVESGAAESTGLTEYAVEGVGTFSLPDGFEVESGINEESLPSTWASLTKDSVTVYVNRFGADAYEAAGVGLPASLEEYSQRDGARSGIPEGTEYAEDEYGNLYVEYTQDGSVTYSALLLNDHAAGGFMVIWPENEEAPDCALWASEFVLE